MRLIKFDMAFMFAYSMREKTHAHRNLAYVNAGDLVLTLQG